VKTWQIIEQLMKTCRIVEQLVKTWRIVEQLVKACRIVEQLVKTWRIVEQLVKTKTKKKVENELKKLRLENLYKKFFLAGIEYECFFSEQKSTCIIWWVPFFKHKQTHAHGGYRNRPLLWEGEKRGQN
jgi:hypothetical protein